MLLYAEGKSLNGIGYIPDWVQWSYEEDGIEYRLTLDLRGSVDTMEDTLSFRIKSDINPWELIDLKNDRVFDLYSNEHTELCNSFTAERTREIIEKAYNFVIGIYPIDDSNYTGDDDIKECIGEISFYFEENGKQILYTKQFSFTPECTQ